MRDARGVVRSYVWRFPRRGTRSRSYKSIGAGSVVGSAVVCVLGSTIVSVVVSVLGSVIVSVVVSIVGSVVVSVVVSVVGAVIKVFII